tara:strand:- start:283 stop:462 length:180 start_codon:yes stop_codon:yes gene_type:complete
VEKLNSRTNTSLIKETIIREQLKRLFPRVAMIDIIFCANKMTKQLDGYKLDLYYDGGKC